jgi:hypothetical protein
MVLALVVGSALVAQHGWPGVDPPVRAVELYSDGSLPTSPHHRVSAPLRIPAAALAAPVHRTRVLVGARPLLAQVQTSGLGLSVPAVGPRKHLIPLAPRPAPSPAAPAPAAPTPTAAPVVASTSAGELVQHAGQTLSGTISTVSPQAGQAVSQIAGAVAGTVDSTTQAVAGSAGAGTNALLKTAAPATQAVNNVVNSVTGLLSGPQQPPPQH